MIFRRAEAADTEALRALMRGSNGYAMPQARAMIETYAASWSPDHNTWLAEDDRGLIGFHRLNPIDDETLDLDLMFVADARQGEGHGARLFSHLCETARARGARRIVIVANPAALEFYRRQGARDDGTVPAGRLVPGRGRDWSSTLHEHIFSRTASPAQRSSLISAHAALSLPCGEVIQTSTAAVYGA